MSWNTPTTPEGKAWLSGYVIALQDTLAVLEAKLGEAVACRDSDVH